MTPTSVATVNIERCHGTIDYILHATKNKNKIPLTDFHYD